MRICDKFMNEAAYRRLVFIYSYGAIGGSTSGRHHRERVLRRSVSLPLHSPISSSFRNYPGVKTYDMETVAARELPPNSPRPLAPAQSHFNGQLNGDGPSPLLSDQAERLRQYEEDLRKRRQKNEQRAKEQEFLRFAFPAYFFVRFFAYSCMPSFFTGTLERSESAAVCSCCPALSDCMGEAKATPL